MKTEPFLNSNSVLLVDGSNLLIRIMHAKTKGGSLSTEKEIIEDCCVIFINQIVINIRKYSCSKLFIFFDLGSSLRKSAIYKEYKANREFKATSGMLAAFGDSSESAFSILREKVIALCRSFNFPIYMEYGVEADDMIGILSEVLNTLNKQTIILSNDSDFLQLTKFHNVICSIPYKKEEVSYLNFPSYFNNYKKISIAPNEYLYYKALVGDNSDNIEGIPKIGYITLHKHTNEYLANNQEHIDLLLSDTLNFIEVLNSSSSNSKLETLIKDNYELIKRNLKLIDLSSKYMSATCIHDAYKLLKTSVVKPDRKQLILEYKNIFSNNPNISFILDSMMALKKLYE